jgi:hypothetical protein
MSLEDNLRDLAKHARDFAGRRDGTAQQTPQGHSSPKLIARVCNAKAISIRLPGDDQGGAYES